jgi:hypothetical protein
MNEKIQNNSNNYVINYVDDSGEILPFPDSERQQAYYVKEFFNWSMKNNRTDLIDKWNGVKDKINPPIHDLNLHSKITEEDMKNATRENLFAKNMVVMEFGEDFAEALLTVAEKTSNYQLDVILESIESCRNSVTTITEWYNKFDGGEFAEQYKKASSERLTDMLVAIESIATDGKLDVDLDWAGKVNMTLNEAIYALKLEEKSLKIIPNVVNDVTNSVNGAYAKVEISKNNEYDKTKLYRFHSDKHGDALLYTRPEGWSKFDKSFEYGNYSGVEASISWIVNPYDPFNLSPFKDKNGVSALRLDREGRSINEAPSSQDRNPVRKDGIVSVDIAAILDDPNTPSGMIGRLVAAGNALRARRNNRDINLNHNTNYFNQAKYGTEYGFRNIVEYVQIMAENSVLLTNKKSVGKKAMESNSVTRKNVQSGSVEPAA